MFTRRHAHPRTRHKGAGKHKKYTHERNQTYAYAKIQQAHIHRKYTQKQIQMYTNAQYTTYTHIRSMQTKTRTNTNMHKRTPTNTPTGHRISVLCCCWCGVSQNQNIGHNRCPMPVHPSSFRSSPVQSGVKMLCPEFFRSEKLCPVRVRN